MRNISQKCSYCHNDIIEVFHAGDKCFCSEICYNRFKVMTLFNWRCALNPSHAASTIHEIVPRSLRPKNWWDEDNMIPLCWQCHDEVHSKGTKKYANKLREILKNAKN